MTIVTGGTDGLHWGYVVDEPNRNPLGIAGYFAHDDVSVFQESTSLFQFLAHQIQATFDGFRQRFPLIKPATN